MQPDYKQLQKIIDLLPHAEAALMDWESSCGGANDECPKCLLQAYITRYPAEPCEWTDETIPQRRGEGGRKYYKTGCGKAYSVVGGLRFKFCPFCGKPVKELKE